jgi:hypothetical protein
MSKGSVEFARLEEYRYGDQSVITSFDTTRFGKYQIKCCKREDRVRQYELLNEPPLDTFTKADQRYIERVSVIVWRMLFG